MQQPGVDHGRRNRRKDAASAFGTILDALSRQISPALIDDAGWARLCDAVGDLPVDPGSGFGFELRLADAAAETDFYITLPRGSSLGDHYIRLGKRAPPGSASAALGNRLAAIENGGSVVRPPVCRVRFGVRLARRASGAVRGGSGPTCRKKALRALLTPPSIAEWLAGAVGWRLVEGEGRALRRAFDAVTAAGSSVDCLGIMPGRTPEGIQGQ